MKTRIAAILLAAVALGAATVLSDQSTSLRLTMTVAPGAPECRLVVELFDENGYLLERSEPACPPAKIVVAAPNGQSVGVLIPDVALEAPATIQVYFKGTRSKRDLIARANRESASRGISAVTPLEALEFVFSGDLPEAPKVCLCYPSDLEGPVADALGVFRLEESGGWRRLPECELDRVACTIAAPIETSSVVRAMVEAATDLGRLRVYPNPFVPGLARGGSLKFVNLTPEATVRLYDIGGSLVWKQDVKDTGGAAFWDGLNTAGKDVASGVYFYVVTDSRGNKTTGKVTLAR